MVTMVTNTAVVTPSSWKARLLLLVERIAWTFVYQLFAMVAVTLKGGENSNLHNVQWTLILSSAGFAALISAGTGVVALLTALDQTLSGFVDALVRVVLTFIQSFLGALMASGVADLGHINWSGALAVAVAATVPSLLKVIAALGAPTFSASTVPLAVEHVAKVA